MNMIIENIEQDPEAKRIPDYDLSHYAYDAMHQALGSLRSIFHSRSLHKRLTQQMIARRIGKKKEHVSRVLRGRTNPTLRTLSDLARGMDCRLEMSFVPLEELPHKANDSFDSVYEMPMSLGGEFQARRINVWDEMVMVKVRSTQSNQMIEVHG